MGIQSYYCNQAKQIRCSKCKLYSKCSFKSIMAYFSPDCQWQTFHVNKNFRTVRPEPTGSTFCPQSVNLFAEANCISIPDGNYLSRNGVEYWENLTPPKQKGRMAHPSKGSRIAPYSSAFQRVEVGSPSNDSVFFIMRQNTQKDVKENFMTVQTPKTQLCHWDQMKLILKRYLSNGSVSENNFQNFLVILNIQKSLYYVYTSRY